MTLKEAQYLIKHIELGTLEEKEDTRTAIEKKDNIQRLVLKLIEEAFDIFYYIIAIANEYDIDLEKVFLMKDKLNQEKYKREFSLEEAREMYKKVK